MLCVPIRIACPLQYSADFVSQFWGHRPNFEGTPSGISIGVLKQQSGTLD